MKDERQSSSDVITRRRSLSDLPLGSESIRFTSLLMYDTCVYWEGRQADITRNTCTRKYTSLELEKPKPSSLPLTSRKPGQQTGTENTTRSSYPGHLLHRGHSFPSIHEQIHKHTCPYTVHTWLRLRQGRITDTSIYMYLLRYRSARASLSLSRSYLFSLPCSQLPRPSLLIYRSTHVYR